MAFKSITAQRALGAELRKYREAAGLSTREVGEMLEWHHTKVSRIENAQSGLTRRDLAKLMGAYEIPETDRARLDGQLQDSRADKWWQPYERWIVPTYRQLIAYENEASVIWNADSTVVCGLLQVPSYMRALFERSELITDRDAIDALVKVRELRQRRLTEPEPPRLIAIMAQAVLLNQYGDAEVQYEQLGHLRAMAELPNVEIRIIPFSGMVSLAPMGLYEFGGGDPKLAYLETTWDNVFLDNELQIRQAERVLDHLSQAACSPKDSLKIIDRTIGEWK